MKIAEGKKTIYETIDKKLEELNLTDRVEVEIPISVEDYKLNHPRGVFLIVYKGSVYLDSDAEDFIQQNRDMQFGVIAVVRKKTTGMAPEDYLDWVREKLTGVEVDVDRAERKIYPLDEEWIKEENGVWWYGITFALPSHETEI